MALQTFRLSRNFRGLKSKSRHGTKRHLGKLKSPEIRLLRIKKVWDLIEEELELSQEERLATDDSIRELQKLHRMGGLREA